MICEEIQSNTVFLKSQTVQPSINHTYHSILVGPATKGAIIVASIFTIMQFPGKKNEIRLKTNVKRLKNPKQR